MRVSWYTTKYQYWSDNTRGRGKIQTTFPELYFLWLYTRQEVKLERERPSTSTTEHTTNYTVLNARWNVPGSGSHTNTGFPNSKVEKKLWRRQWRLSQAPAPACVFTKDPWFSPFRSTASPLLTYRRLSTSRICIRSLVYLVPPSRLRSPPIPGGKLNIPPLKPSAHRHA